MITPTARSAHIVYVFLPVLFSYIKHSDFMMTKVANMPFLWAIAFPSKDIHHVLTNDTPSKKGIPMSLRAGSFDSVIIGCFFIDSII